MSKYLALHTLHLASAKSGAIDVIPAGHRFDSIEADDIDALMERGALREATGKDSQAPEAKRPAGDVAKPSSTNSVDGQKSSAAVTVPDDKLDALKVEELKGIAQQLQVADFGGMKKDDLVAAIKAKRAESADDLV